MKYIRTEDGHIYEIQTLEYDSDFIGYFKGVDDNFNLHNSLRKWQLECKNPYYLTTPNGYTTCEKQADTIEELCDEFVIKPKNNMKNWLAFGVNVKHLKESIYNLNYPIKEVYGAIWTEKGLIYVAKMNEKGELELL